MEPVIKGIAIAVFLATLKDFRGGLKDLKWWIAMMSLNAMVNI